jgi:hypothetical protein
MYNIDYDAPTTWIEACTSSFPTAQLERTQFLAGLNLLIESTLESGGEIEIPQKGTAELYRTIENFHVMNRTKILNEKDGRDASELLFVTYSRLRFLLYGSEWSRSTTCGADFTELSSQQNRIIVDSDTPIFRYTMRTLRMSIMRLLHEWKGLPFSTELVKYVDHLHRRVCAFLTGAFPSRIHNFKKWRLRVNSKDTWMANSRFLTLMDIYFSELRWRIICYENMLKNAVTLGDIVHYPRPKKDVLHRAYEWLQSIARDVYADEVKRIHSEEYAETCVLPGETELYKYDVREEGMLHNPQSIISHFRAQELEVIQQLSDMKIEHTLNPQTRVGDPPVHPRPKGDRSLETMMMSVVEFTFKSQFSVSIRGKYWMCDSVLKEHNEQTESTTRGKLRTNDLISGMSSREAEEYEPAPELLFPLSELDKADGPILFSFFNRLCVAMRGVGVFVCTDPFSALCCWFEMFVKHAPTVIPGIKSIYEHIFNNVDYSNDRKEREIRDAYGGKIKQFAIWKPDEQRHTEASSVTSELAG